MKSKGQIYLKKDRLQKEKRETEYSLEDDFKLFSNASSIPIPNTPFYTSFGIMGICKNGNVTIGTHQQEHRFVKGELMVILPKQTRDLAKTISFKKFNLHISIYH